MPSGVALSLGNGGVKSPVCRTREITGTYSAFAEVIDNSVAASSLGDFTNSVVEGTSACSSFQMLVFVMTLLCVTVNALALQSLSKNFTCFALFLYVLVFSSPQLSFGISSPQEEIFFFNFDWPSGFSLLKLRFFTGDFEVPSKY